MKFDPKTIIGALVGLVLLQLLVGQSALDRLLGADNTSPPSQGFNSSTGDSTTGDSTAMLAGIRNAGRHLQRANMPRPTPTITPPPRPRPSPIPTINPPVPGAW